MYSGTIVVVSKKRIYNSSAIYIRHQQFHFDSLKMAFFFRCHIGTPAICLAVLRSKSPVCCERNLPIHLKFCGLYQNFISNRGVCFYEKTSKANPINGLRKEQ